jgi:plasmid stabilization system protein ParE
MPQVVVSLRANLDLFRLHAFLADKNRQTAARAIKTIRAKLRLLRRHPSLGRLDADQPDDRELFIKFGAGGYMARYNYDGTMVIVLSIRHAYEAGYHGDAD